MQPIWWPMMWGSRIDPTSVNKGDGSSIRLVNDEDEAEESIKMGVSFSPQWTTATPRLGSRCSNTSSHVADRVLVLQLGVRPELLRGESRVQDIGPPETSRSHILSISKSSPRDLCIQAKTQFHSMTSKLQCWTSHAKQLARQEHNPTH